MVDVGDQKGAGRPDVWSALARASQVEPRPFTSSIPLIGPLIAFVREAWYNVAARWQDQLLFEQQNRFNRQVHEILVRQQQAIEELAGQLHERGLEAGILAEELARLKLKPESDGVGVPSYQQDEDRP
jgi:hypothetical protein